MNLTPREKEILSLLLKGMSGKEMASELNTSWQTIRNQLSMIYFKMGVRDKTQAVIKVLENKNGS